MKDCGQINVSFLFFPTDSLKLENVKRVVIDWSWRELKMRRLIDMPDVRSQLFDLLKTSIIPRLKEGNCKLALM